MSELSVLSIPGAIRKCDVDVVLKEWFKVGDEVTLNTGESGIVIGFGEKYIARGGFRHKYAGTYIDFEKLFIAPTDGSPRTFVSVESFNKMKILPGYLSSVFIRIGDLPETPFWEGDIVAFRDKVVKKSDGGHVQNYDCHTVVSHKYLKDGHIECWISSTERVETRIDFPEKITLIRRGNLWKMGHGEPMKFTSIEEEAKFYQSLGMSQKITHNHYRGFVGETKIATEEWGMEAALSFIREGKANEMKLKDKKLMTFVVIKYDNEEFGKRMRTHTLAKFGLGEDVSE